MRNLFSTKAVSYTHLDVYKRQPYITDTGAFLEDALSKGKRVVLEAQRCV